MFRLFKSKQERSNGGIALDAHTKTHADGLQSWVYNESTGAVETFIATDMEVPELGYTFGALWMDPERIQKLDSWHQSRANGLETPSPIVTLAFIRVAPGIEFDGSNLLIMLSGAGECSFSFMHSFFHEQMNDGSTRIVTCDISDSEKLAKCFGSGESFQLTIYQGEGETISDLTQMALVEFSGRVGFTESFLEMNAKGVSWDSNTATGTNGKYYI